MSKNKKSSSNANAFKNWFSPDAAGRLADQLSPHVDTFNRRRFLRAATRSLDSLEFHARVKQFARALRGELPDDVPRILAALSASQPEPQSDCENVTDGWLQWPIGQLIADLQVEVGTQHLDAAMDAMVALTQRFTSEFAVRPYVAAYPDEILARMLALTDHPSPHVRRWCSEGIRPRLPWGAVLRAFVADPSPLLPILEALKDDPVLYVRRSVANTLNDIAKDNPTIVVRIANRWEKNASDNRRWLVRHALRSLIKNGNPDALAIVGYSAPKRLSASLTAKPTRVRLGESVTLEAMLQSPTSQSLLVDYVVHYVGKTTAREKVFKWTRLTLEAKSSITLTKRHAMKATTIRALYPGTHRVELQVNGARVAECAFVFGS